MTKSEREIECPIEGCDYTNTPGSVEAHVTASTDGEHQGEMGIEHRPTFPEWARQEAHDHLDYENIGETDTDRPDGSESDGSGVRLTLPAKDESESSETAPREGNRSAPTTENRSSSGSGYHSGAENGGLDAGAALILGTVFAVIGVLLGSRSSEDYAPTEPEASSTADEDGGLID